MSDLPSREMVHHADNIHDFPTYMERVLLPLAFAWQSGRLVDGDTIDYERAARIHHHALRLVHNGMSDEVPHWDELDDISRQGLILSLQHSLAIGDSDE